MKQTKRNKKMDYTFVGIDSHKATHTAVFLDCFFDKLGEMTFGTAPRELEDFYKQAKAYCQEGTSFAWSMEDISAYGRTLAKVLVEKGELVKHCDATLVAKERNATGVLLKTDRVDAECCARVLLNRFDKLPTAHPQDKYFILSTLVTRRKFLAKVNMMAKKQLHAFIYENYPSYKEFFSKMDGQGALHFFETYPSPSTLEGVTVEDFTLFLRKASRNSLSTTKAKQILDLVQKDDVQPIAFQKQRDFTIQSVVKQIKTHQEETKLIDQQIKAFMKYFDYNLTQIKGIDITTEAMFITEIGDISRFKNASSLAKYAGVAPVTHASGTSVVQYANKRGNRDLNELFYRLSVIQSLPRGKKHTVLNPLFHEYYHKKLREGKTKNQALKCVQRRLVNIIFSMMKHGKDYTDPPAVNLDDLKVNEETGEIMED